jgi:AraC family transcriptional regulator of adaptative response / DNA-3-methyladenine glycosylase II
MSAHGMQIAPMAADRDACYRALRTRDARFDGRFFICVRSTGVYCRPVCPARPPKLENCVFLPSAAAAQEAGFRPCLRCRPEASPDTFAWRGTSNTVSRALRLIAEGSATATFAGCSTATSAPRPSPSPRPGASSSRSG